MGDENHHAIFESAVRLFVWRDGHFGGAV